MYPRVDFSCASRHRELSPSDLIMLASMYTDMAINHLNSGNLKIALSSSKISLLFFYIS